MTMAEAGRLGAKKAAATNAERIRRIRDAYEDNPKRCQQCRAVLVYEKRWNKFCSMSCAATFNNQGLRRHEGQRPKCLACRSILKRSSRKFCCVACQHEYQYKRFIERWLAGKEDGKSGGLGTSKHIRRWVEERDGRKCLLCERTTWTSRKIPLVLDHIDGNSQNNTPGNLRLICPNCDQLQPTWGGRNRGNGRKARLKYDRQLSELASCPVSKKGDAPDS